MIENETTSIKLGRDKVFSALCKAQAEMHNAVKSSNNPYFKSKYADLATVWEVAKGPLHSNGICLTQVLDGTDLVTILGHTSGQYLESRINLRPVKDDPQSMGACITYMRRFSLAAICGIATEDDDGNTASGNNTGGQSNSSVHNPTPVAPRASKPAVNSLYRPDLPTQKPAPVAPSPATDSKPTNAVSDMPPMPEPAPGSTATQEETSFNRENEVHKRVLKALIERLYTKDTICGKEWQRMHLANLAKKLTTDGTKIKDIETATREFYRTSLKSEEPKAVVTF
jgi:hypothetical protein